jgi:acyl-CoA synthetase
MPEYFLALDDIPLTATGKILKRTLVEQVRDGRLTPVPVRWQAKEGSGLFGAAMPPE